MNLQKPLQSKTILIAGAAGRIGKQIVSAVLQAGGSVMALDTDVEGLASLKATHGLDRLSCAPMDLRKRESIEEAIVTAETRFGSVDGAVNTTYPRNVNYGRDFFEVQYVDFCENAGLHMGAYFLFMQCCARHMVDQNSERTFSLVNLSSIYGSMSPRFEIYDDTAMTMPVEYSAIKAGIEQMTRYVNAYTKHRVKGFRANCVSPGGIKDGQPERFLANYREHCMSKGMLESSDIVGAIVFLLSDNSRYIVGQNILVDDGFCL